MRPGPPPIPLELKILRGNPGKRRLPKRRLKPTLGARCPDWLSPSTKVHWRQIAPMLRRLGLLTELDRSALACLCQALSDLEWAEDTVAREGRTQMGVGGTAIAHPAVLIARQAREHVRKFGAEFGLSPAMRSRAEVAEGEEDPDSDERFFGPRPAPAPKTPGGERRGRKTPA